MAGYGPVDSGHDESSVEVGEATAPDEDAAGPGARRWRKRDTGLIVLLVVVIAAAVAWFIQLPYYALTPGAAPDVAGLIHIEDGPHYHHTGSVHLVYVEETRIRALEWPFFKLDPNADIVPAGAVLGVETPAQYQTEGEIDMSTAQQAATVVALQQLGYRVRVTPVGALVYGVFPGSPAEGQLNVGDVISRLDGKRVRTFSDLRLVLAHEIPGRVVHLVAGAFPDGHKRTITIRLGVVRTTGPQQASCFPIGKGTKHPVIMAVTAKGGRPHAVACMGVYPQGSGGPGIDGTAFHIGKLPVKVDLSSEGIVGPSAGLAFTLGLMQQLDPANLTNGYRIAATGTMSIDGSVGDVGGVAQKTVSVRDSGATVFFVPLQEYKIAESKAGPGLHVYAVTNISQAIHDLESLGGQLQKRSTTRLAGS